MVCLQMFPLRFYSTSVISVWNLQSQILSSAILLEFPSAAPESDFHACFRMQSPPFRLGSHSHCVLRPEWHCVAQRWSSVRLPEARSECRGRRRHCGQWRGGGEEGRRGMAGCSAPFLPPSLCFSFCLSHLHYCRGLAYSPLLPFSCLVPLTLICQSCPAVPCHPRPPGGG